MNPTRSAGRVTLLVDTKAVRIGLSGLFYWSDVCFLSALISTFCQRLRSHQCDTNFFSMTSLWFCLIVVAWHCLFSSSWCRERETSCCGTANLNGVERWGTMTAVLCACLHVWAHSKWHLNTSPCILLCDIHVWVRYEPPMLCEPSESLAQYCRTIPSYCAYCFREVK